MELGKTGINPSSYGRDPDSARQYRREVEQEYRAEIRQLREESRQKDLEIHRLDSELKKLRTDIEYDREKNRRALEAATAWAEASSTGKKVMAIIIGILMLIGGIASTYEHFKQWLSSHN